MALDLKDNLKLKRRQNVFCKEIGQKKYIPEHLTPNNTLCSRLRSEGGRNNGEALKRILVKFIFEWMKMMYNFQNQGPDLCNYDVISATGRLKAF